MLETNTEWNAYNLGRTAAGGITPSGAGRAGWFSPQQVAKIELAYKKDTAGVVAQRDALLEALIELDPNHPLAKKEERLARYNEGYDNYREKK